MKAEELVALVGPQGVDLLRAAQLTGPARRQFPTVRMRSAIAGKHYPVLAPRSGREAEGRSSPSYERPTWSVSELAQAAYDVPPLHFMAACYAYAGDTSVRWKLWEALHFTAGRLRERENWPRQVRGPQGAHFYLAELANLVLLEDENQHVFNAAPALYWIYMQVEEETWRRSLFERFDQVKLRYLGWINEAMRVMQPRLEEHEEA